MSNGMSPDEYLGGKTREGAALFRSFAKLVQACGDDVVVSMSRTAAHFRRTYEFASCSVQRRQLEVVINLPRKVEHPRLQRSSLTAEAVYSHTFDVTSTGDLYAVVDLLKEAYETVGVGKHAGTQ